VRARPAPGGFSGYNVDVNRKVKQIEIKKPGKRIKKKTPRRERVEQSGT
jgi:hypothetical protein